MPRCTHILTTRRGTRPLLRGGGPTPEDGGLSENTINVDSESDEECSSHITVSQLTDWIACGKTWNDAIPSYVKHARNNSRLVPAASLSLSLPGQDETISSVLAHHERFSRKLEDPAMYSNDVPNILLPDTPSQITDCLNHLWASTNSAAPLRLGFNTAWLNGAQSIIIPSDPSHRYPLWVEKLLQEMYHCHKKQRLWYASASWLSETACLSPSSAVLAAECQETFGVLPWAGPVPGFSSAVHLTMADLSRFLSNEWLNDEMINAGLDYILRDMQEGCRVMLVNSLFISSLRKMRKRENWYSRKDTQLDKAIYNKDTDELYIPLHVCNSHWTLIKIDLVNYTYSYSDSLSRSAQVPMEIMSLLQWWLEQLMPEVSGKTLKSIAAPYSMPQQRDSYSWGVVVLSTLAKHLLDFEPWSNKTKGDHRLQWFLRLTQGLQDSNEGSDDTCGMDVQESLVLQTALKPELQLDDIDLTGGLDNGDNGGLPTNFIASVKQDSRSRKRALSKAETLTLSKKTRHSSHTPGTGHLKAPAPIFRPRGAGFFKFRTSILELDVHAEFHAKSDLLVRCSSCSKWLKMRSRHDTKNFKIHRNTASCLEKQHSPSTPSLLTFFKPVTRQGISAPTSAPVHTIQLPCPGLTKESRSDVAQYLRRTATAGGGAPSRSKIANSLYGSDNLLWRHLSPLQKRAVCQREIALYRWRNFRNLGTVFSARCMLEVGVTNVTEEPPACTECQSLLSLQVFRAQLRRPMPSEQNMKFVPKRWRDEDVGHLYIKYHGLQKLLDEDGGGSPWLKFAKGVVDGLYVSNEVVLGMVQALVIKTDRLQKDQTLKGITYTRIFSDFANTMASLSPRAYEMFRQHLGGPTTRSLRHLRAKAPRFKPGIARANFQAAKAVIERLGYHGPLTLSWDDTALEPALAIYQESKNGVFTILGSSAGQIDVQSEADLDRVFDDAQKSQADKLRLYLVGVPLHKVPPMVVAAVSRKGSDSAGALYSLHNKIIQMLHSVEIFPVSMSADGTEVERSLQRTIESAAVKVTDYVIPNLIDTCQITIHLHFQDNSHPFVTLQDSNHGRKTGRNQLFTGARLLVMGRSAMFYSQLRDCVISPGVVSPLFHRDIEKVDRQDDRAAARLTSAAFLSHILASHPEWSALPVYLFILGEMIDAWQNRLITHLERVTMVMTARFVLMAWRTHVTKHPAYLMNIQFISRESYEIFIKICDGLLSLIILYRQYHPTYPLLPWLHGTENCEHIFGILRQLKTDFTYMDMLYLQPKLRTLLIAAFSHIVSEQDVKATAAGYDHSYVLDTKIDLCALAQWPTDAEMAEASHRAFDNAQQLLKAVGIEAMSMLADYKHPIPSSTPKQQCAYADARPRGPATLAELVALYDASAASVSFDQQDRIEACQTALVSESIGRTMDMYVYTPLSDSIGQSSSSQRIVA
ncbi:hypothetical protein BC835DRAFT_1414529 [Cytidiella melzeri]|nr:hypothetical protein BC835DRAFT_1414529 [Cytidiella melzeri]